jgi:hypothetical protein
MEDEENRFDQKSPQIGSELYAKQKTYNEEKKMHERTKKQ